MNAEGLLLDEGVRRAEIDLQARGEADRAKGAMRRDGDIVRFGHRGDFLQFADAAGVGAIRLDDVRAAAGEKLLEAPARKLAFAGGDGDGGHGTQIEQRLVVLGKHRLFDEKRADAFEFFHQDFRHALVDAPMKVDRDAEIGAAGVANRGRARHRFGDAPR